MDKIFFLWIIIASMSIFLELEVEGNLGLLIAILIIPIFIHDIILKFCNFYETKQENLTLKK